MSKVIEHTSTILPRSSFYAVEFCRQCLGHFAVLAHCFPLPLVGYWDPSPCAWLSQALSTMVPHYHSRPISPILGFRALGIKRPLSRRP